MHFYVWSKSLFLAHSLFIPQKTPTFFFAQLSPVVARTWFASWSERFFFGPKSRFLIQESNFCNTTPILVKRPVCSPWRDGSFPTLGSIFLLFVSELCREKTRSTCQKVFPLPTVGALSASNSPSALSGLDKRFPAIHLREILHEITDLFFKINSKFIQSHACSIWRKLKFNPPFPQFKRSSRLNKEKQDHRRSRYHIDFWIIKCHTFNWSLNSWGSSNGWGSSNSWG